MKLLTSVLKGRSTSIRETDSSEVLLCGCEVTSIIWLPVPFPFGDGTFTFVLPGGTISFVTHSGAATVRVRFAGGPFKLLLLSGGSGCSVSWCFFWGVSRLGVSDDADDFFLFLFFLFFGCIILGTNCCSIGVARGS